MTGGPRRPGLVVRLEANRPTVRLDDGTVWLAHLSGRVKRRTGPIFVGDRVEVEPIDDRTGVVVAVAPRGVTLARPPVANVTGLGVVFTLQDPAGSLDLLDRRLVLAELSDLAAVVIAHKADLVEPARRMVLEPWARVYPVLWTSARTGEGLDEAAAALAQGLFVLTGESGAGKTSLLEALVPGSAGRAQTLGRQGRGRQTTRVVSLVPVAGGWLADTPGFTHLDLPRVSAARLAAAFPEWRGVRCRFANCRHAGEPGCAVADRVAAGSVSAVRYAHYRRYLAEMAS